MNCVILQPSYIPWRGFFHQIQKADVFVFYDDVQYDKRGWRNRNRIKTANGSTWLTVPVFSKGVTTNKTPIHQIKMNGETKWQKNHLATIQQSYGKAPYFESYWDFVSSLYDQEFEMLADLTIHSTIALAKALNIHSTAFKRSSEIDLPDVEKTDRLIHVLQAVGATHYITGPSAADYIEMEKFQEAGITLEYMTYDYPEYEQLHPPFDPQVSILDLLFMAGPAAGELIWGKVPEQLHIQPALK